MDIGPSLRYFRPMDIPDDSNQNCFDGKLGRYRILETEDGTPTLHSDFFNEACHSLAGARGETIYNYVEGCEVVSKFLKGDLLSLLEVGFGLGLGYVCTLESLIKSDFQDQKLSFVSVELDPTLIEWTKENINLDEELTAVFPGFQELEFYPEQQYFRACKNGHNLTILIGDARETVPRLKDYSFYSPFKVIYQDPFSPKRNPALWTLNWFQLLKELSHQEVILSTYSSSPSIRKTLLETGFKVFNRKGYKTKKRCTLARLTGSSDEVVLKETSSDKISVLSD